MPPNPAPTPNRRSFLRLTAGVATSVSPGLVTMLLAGCDESPPPAPPEGAPPALVDDSHPRPLPPAFEPTVRVRIRRVEVRDETLEIGSPGRRFLVQDDGTPATDLILTGPIWLSMGPTGWRLRDGTAFRPDPVGLDSLTIRPIDRPDDPVPLDEVLFPGVLRVVAQTDLGPSRFDVINIAPLESYLPGVLSGELFSHWHADAFRAQAVAARSYAIMEIHYWRHRRSFDVTNTTSSQVYEGVSMHERSLDAVASTRGEVLLWEDRIVPGYYSACCGGAAARAVDVIGSNPANDIPPLHGRVGADVCTEAPVYSWRVVRDRAALEARLRAFAVSRRDDAVAGLTRLRAIAPKELNEHGRPMTFLIEGDGIRGEDSGAAGAERRAEWLREALNSRHSGVEDPPRDVLSSFISEVRIQGGASGVTIRGRGHGHGAGLCQYGAQALARDGHGWREIINWYYPGAAIRRVYE